MLHPIILECLKQEIPVELSYDEDGECVIYVVGGFCKSSQAELIVQTDNTILAKTRYDQMDTIESFQDLAELAFEWFDKSCSDTWQTPPPCWQEADRSY